ncbi:MAG TPA: ester cyclase [Prolixibacteraceae bacterium]|jgi:steroid delta-isomerase-like uncharacterized protein
MEDFKKTVEQYMDAITRCDFSKMRHMMHQEYSYTGSDAQRLNGPDKGISVAELYTKAFPDLNFEIKNMYASGGIIVTEFIAHGTHRGELMGISPTNRKVAVPVCNITEIRDGKIYAEHEYFDNAFLMHQLGVEVGHEHA